MLRTSRKQGWRNRCYSVCRRGSITRPITLTPTPPRPRHGACDTTANRGPTQSQADLEQGFVGPWLGRGVDTRSSTPDTSNFGRPAAGSSSCSPSFLRIRQYSLPCRHHV
ncbi:hypothetical protein BDZ89DRAFT_1068802 [Hymenopellis radicata]|nr:hypothetical protein BDZ89DRAFT_1068802 [Hymenopellis radicata]